MKALFTAIRQSDFEKVKTLIERKPELVNCVAKQPPKKDDGQSPLQVAFKTGNFDIADYLVDQGANVNFIEAESINEWKAPVIHDAIRATVFSSRFPGYGGIQNSRERFERA
jgi:Ankyrin repeat.